MIQFQLRIECSEDGAAKFTADVLRRIDSNEPEEEFAQATEKLALAGLETICRTAGVKLQKTFELDDFAEDE